MYSILAISRFTIFALIDAGANSFNIASNVVSEDAKSLLPLTKRLSLFPFALPLSLSAPLKSAPVIGFRTSSSLMSSEYFKSATKGSGETLPALLILKRFDAKS